MAYQIQVSNSTYVDDIEEALNEMRKAIESLERHHKEFPNKWNNSDSGFKVGIKTSAGMKIQIKKEE